MMLSRRKGQSTLEYVLILTAVIAGIIFATTQFIQPRVQDSVNHVTNQMNSMVGRLSFPNGS
ncbi:MAG: hypothetical protein WC695_08270 [Candidatus Omnitrophota bacterium]|jgi:uncharacterized protein (UPF0333 family)